MDQPLLSIFFPMARKSVESSAAYYIIVSHCSYVLFVQYSSVGGMSHYRSGHVHLPLPGKLWYSYHFIVHFDAKGFSPIPNCFYTIIVIYLGLRYLEAFFGLLITIMCGMFGWMVSNSIHCDPYSS